MKNNNNRKNIMYMNILGEYVAEVSDEIEEKLEFGEKVTYLVTSPDSAEPYEIEHIYGQGLPAELVREEVELTAAMNKFITKAKLIGENAIKERLGFELSDIKEKRVKGQLDIRLAINTERIEGFKVVGSDIKKLVIPDFITSVGIIHHDLDVIEQLEIGEHLKTFICEEGLIVENIKLSKKNKYFKLIDNKLYSYNGDLIIQTGYDLYEI